MQKFDHITYVLGNEARSIKYFPYDDIWQIFDMKWNAKEIDSREVSQIISRDCIMKRIMHHHFCSLCGASINLFANCGLGNTDHVAGVCNSSDCQGLENDLQRADYAFEKDR